MNIYDQISIRIIKEQELIIGPVAWEEAKKVQGFKVVDKSHDSVEIEGDPKEIVSNLVMQYSRLFGRASTEVCKEAVSDIVADMSTDQIPVALK